MQQNKTHRVAVIGSGFGGLAAAIRLQARGYRCEIMEMGDQPGGRAAVFREKGFTFDAGPTIVTAPFLFEELFWLAGKKMEDYVRLVPCDPFYRIVFSGGETFTYTGDKGRMLEEIAKFNPKDVAGYRCFQTQSKEIFERAFVGLADHSFDSFWKMVKVAPDLLRVRSHESVYQFAKRHISDPMLRQVFSFHPLFVGGHPFRASSVYAMIHYLEQKWGVHYVMGGTGKMVDALVKIFLEMGGCLRLNTKVEEVVVEEGRAVGVKTSDGSFHPAEAVISNGDVANVYRKRVAPKWRSKWTDRHLMGMQYSMGVFMLYFGVNKTYPSLTHHTIFMGPRYKGLLDDIFERKVLADDFSLYLHTPTRTDASVAPDGCECFYALSPVPHLGAGINWAEKSEAYAEKILEFLEKAACPDLRKHIVCKRVFTPRDYERTLDCHLGSAFQFEPILTQSAWFRPHNISEDVRGLYLVGAGTHPGAGLPGVLCSAKIIDKLLPQPGRGEI